MLGYTYLDASNILSHKRADFLPLISFNFLWICALLAAIFVVIIVFCAAYAHPNVPDDPTEELPYRNLDRLDPDLIAELDYYPMLIGLARSEHVSISTFVKKG